jgi:hypothetical protein
VGILVRLAGNLLGKAGMIQNSFFQKVFLTMFWGLCAAGVVEFYRHMIWQANEDINGAAGLKTLYGDSRQVAHPISPGSSLR